MERKPIEGIMTTAMESIRDMVDVNTVIGDPVTTSEGSTVIPVSRVSFGFAAGGGDCPAKEDEKKPEGAFAGGAGAGVSVQPVGFLVLEKDGVRLLPALYATPLDRLIELAPQAFAEMKRYFAAKADDAERSPRRGSHCGCGKPEGGKAPSEETAGGSN